MTTISTVYRWQYLGRQWYAGRVRDRRRPVCVGVDTYDRPRRVLIVLVGLLGDAVMSTPVIVEARRLWPDARLVLLGNGQTCELLSACPLIDECVLTPAIPFTLRKRRQVAELESWLKKSDFDVAMILLGDQFAQVLANARIPKRVGVSGHFLSPFLTRTYDIGPRESWGPLERLGALRALGHDVHNVAPQLWISDDARSAAHGRLRELGLPEGVPYAVAHPFGSTSAKWWPRDYIEDLAHNLRRDQSLRTIVVGGPETRGALGLSDHNIIDSRGALSVAELMAVIDEATVVISTDSGPFHIAGALGRPLVGLFRARRPEHAGRYRQAEAVYGHDETCDLQCGGDRCRELPCRQMRGLAPCYVMAAVRRALVSAERADRESVVGSRA